MTVRELKVRLAEAKDDGEVQIMVIGDTGPVVTHSVDHIGLRDPKSHSYGPMPEVVIVSGVFPPDTAIQERG